MKEAVGRPKTDSFVDDDGWVPTVISCIRIVTCFVTMMMTTLLWSLILLVLYPWPHERIRQGNVYGHVTGRLLVSYPLLFHYSCQACNFLDWLPADVKRDACFLVVGHQNFTK